MSKEISYGYCHCGCNQKTKLIDRNNKNTGLIKGQPNKFLRGHNNYSRNGGKVKRSGGYMLQKVYNHPNENQAGYIPYSHFVVEKVLGKFLPNNCEVHHVNGICDDDRHKNLVVCQDRAYHKLIHRRQRAFDACGNANWRKCWICKQYDDPKNIYIYSDGKYEKTYHNKCANEYNKKNKLKKASKEG